MDNGGNALITTNPTAAKATWSAPVKVDPGGGLTGVSCASTSLCVAVDGPGYAVLTTNPTAASPKWSGPTSIDASALRGIDGTSYLSGISCASTSLCVAVDGVGNAVVGSGAGALPPSSISPPTISGKASEGHVLYEAHGSWTSNPTRFTYQWEHCDNSGGRCSAISGATRRTYKLTAHDVGHTIRVQESAADAAGPGGTAISPHTAVVRPSAAQIEATLEREITPHGKAARIVTLLNRQGYQLTFRAIIAGRVEIGWYFLPARTHLANRQAEQNPVLVGAGRTTFSKAGTSRITIRLTADGKRLLTDAKRITLTARCTFTPAASSAVIATRTFTLTR